MKVSLINPNVTNNEIYGATDVSSLVKSILDNGLFEPLVITREGNLLSGHRRLEAIKSLGWEDVDVRVVDVENEVITLIEHNRYRTKSEKDVLRESRFLEKELRSQIGRGRSANKNRCGKKLSLDLELSKATGTGLTKLKQLRSIENYQPELIDDIEKGKISTARAYALVRSKFLQKKPSTSKDKFPKELTGVLRTHNPSLSKLMSQIKQTYPYSLEMTGLTELDRDELKENLKYLSSLDSRELMMTQKKDELDDAELSKSQLNKTRKLLPSNEDIEQWWQTIIRYRVRKEGTNPLDDIEIISPDDGIDGFDNELWRILRTTTSSFEFFSGPGRKMRFFIGFRIKKEFRLLGITSFSSDSQRLLVRDEYIGWDDLSRSKNREHIVNMNTCVASQPFSYNRLGMKFLCCLVPRMIEKWEEKYKTKIVAVTTTSLHGQSSSYQGMKWWKSIGITSGSQIIKPLRTEWGKWNAWLRDHFSDEIDVLNSQSSPLQSKLKFLLRCLDITEKDFQHGHKRGVFVMGLYENWREFLNNKVTQPKLKPTKIDWKDWWIKKSRSRFEKLIEKKEISDDILFYESIDDLTDWLTVRGFDTN